jgi:hypothetical protein
MVIEDNSHNIGTIQTWIEKWYPVAARALQAFAPSFEGKLEEAQMLPLEVVTQKLGKFYQGYLSGSGLATFDLRHSPMPNWIITVVCFLADDGQKTAENSFNGGPIPAHEVSYNPDGKHCHTRPPKIRVVLPHMDGDRPFLFQPGHRTEVRFA